MISDKKIFSFVKHFRAGIIGKGRPHKKCFMVCCPLVYMLRLSGIDCDFIVFEIEQFDGMHEHFCISLPDGRIIDPTASQFFSPDGSPMPEIYFGEIPNHYLIPISTAG